MQIILGAGHRIQFPLISMKNLLEAYAESLKSLHICIMIESDKQPVSIEVDETFSICKDRPYTRKQPRKIFKPQAQISTL